MVTPASASTSAVRSSIAASASASEPKPRQFQRVYKACIPCRKRKVKCDLGSVSSPNGPPCSRCRRSQKSCVFTPDRYSRKAQSRLEQSSSHPSAVTQYGESETVHQGPHQLTFNDDLNVDVTVSDDFRTPGTVSPRIHRSIVDDPNIHHRTNSTGTSHTSNYEYANNDPSPSNASIRPSNGPFQGPRQSPVDSGLTSSVMRTVVSNSNDALSILFEAANHDENNTVNINFNNGDNRMTDCRQTDRQQQDIVHGTGATPRSITSIGVSPASLPTPLSSSSLEALRIWESCRFVRSGWFSAKEALNYVDLFFKNLALWSPVPSEHYATHENHHRLITEEPVLCCTILMISSRYHVLPGIGGASRGYFIHDRLWQHVQTLIMRIMFGQEKRSAAKTRTLGTIEALLLMSEWHSRALHFPPESDGWDTDLMSTTSQNPLDADSDPKSKPSDTWLEHVIEPARRSDRMSWMLLGSALSLSHELGVFDVDHDSGEPSASTQDQRRRAQLRKLLYVYINQLASRLGCVSLMPQNLNHIIERPTSLSRNDGLNQMEDSWNQFISAWIELTKLVKTSSDILFPSASFTKQNLMNGRYIGLLEHMRPLLAHWKSKHEELLDFRQPFGYTLFIEYQYLRIYINSLGMQAVVERALAGSDPDVVLEEVRLMQADDIDYESIQEVIDGCCQILEKVGILAEIGALRYAPVRIFLRITWSSVFLLKAISLGVRNSQLQRSLDILDRSIQALRSSTLDDMHLASRYATLIEVHVSRIRRNFILCARNTRLSTRTSEEQHDEPQQDNRPRFSINDPTIRAGQYGTSKDGISADLIESELSLEGISADDWLSLPFDPSMAPFRPGGSQTFPGLEDDALDFIWNLAP